MMQNNANSSTSTSTSSSNKRPSMAELRRAQAERSPVLGAEGREALNKHRQAYQSGAHKKAPQTASSSSSLFPANPPVSQKIQSDPTSHSPNDPHRGTQRVDYIREITIEIPTSW